MTELRERLGGISPQLANNHRTRLLDAGIISSPMRGTVDFAIPYLRDYLRAQSLGVNSAAST